MKRPDKFDWIFVAFVLVMSAIVFFLTSCNQQEPEFSVLGKWQATNWYCNQCDNANPIDAAATIQFEILTINQEGGLAVTEANRTFPSCSGNCTALSWFTVEASFTDNILRIEWLTGHVFVGKLQGNEFVGTIEYIIPEMSYLFNDDITITRR